MIDTLAVTVHMAKRGHDSRVLTQLSMALCLFRLDSLQQ
jgi:hypothetical protein